MQALLKKAQLRWAGHVARMPDKQLPTRRLFFGEFAQGKRNYGGHEKRYKNTLKAATTGPSVLGDEND